MRICPDGWYPRASSAARALRRREDSGPVTTDQVSFAAARHHAVCSMVQSKVTAGTSLAALAALAEDASRATLHTLVRTGRQRHSPRAQKARPGLPGYLHRHRQEGGTPRPCRGPWNRTLTAASRGLCHTPAPGNLPSTRTMRMLQDCKTTTPQAGIDT